MSFPFTLASDREFDVVGFGTNAVDFLIQVPHYPTFNSKIALSSYTRSPGGEIASTLVGLARLGFSTCYVGRFGSDDAGKIGYESLELAGVSLRFAEFVDDTPNQIAFILIDEQSGERTVIWQRDERLGYAPGEPPLESVALGRILHLTSHDLAACIEMAAAARDAGTIVSADIDRAVDGIAELLPLIDVLITSSEFLPGFTGIEDHRKALHEISRRFGNSVVGVTLGRAGSLIYANGEFVESDGFEAPGGCRDTTGAGDAFRAGLLSGILSGRSLEDASHEANAAASLKCRAVGARSSLPTRAELNTLLKNS